VSKCPVLHESRASNERYRIHPHPCVAVQNECGFCTPTHGCGCILYRSLLARDSCRTGHLDTSLDLAQFFRHIPRSFFRGFSPRDPEHKRRLCPPCRDLTLVEVQFSICPSLQLYSALVASKDSSFFPRRLSSPSVRLLRPAAARRPPPCAPT
jgi:hypothetical protein